MNSISRIIATIVLLASASLAGAYNGPITGLYLGNGTPFPAAYAGTSCTNQFPRSISLNGVATCASVGTLDLDASLGLVTPDIGAATGTSLSLTGQYTSTIVTGTPPFVVSSTTNVPNLYVARATLADSATTNANLTGPITSVGNATAIASQSGTGSTFCMATGCNMTTPDTGASTGASYNKITVTAPATGATLTIQDGKTLSYEEGNWTAAMAAGTSGTITISNSFKTGTYIKIGRMVTVNGYFLVTSVSAPVGAFTITGLPYAPVNSTNNRMSCATMANGLAATAATSLMSRINENTTAIEVVKYSAGSFTALAGDVQGSSDFTISCTYFTN